MFLTMEHGKWAISTLQAKNIRFLKAVTTKISKSTFSHPCSKFLATAKVGSAQYDSLRDGGSPMILLEREANQYTTATITTRTAVLGERLTSGTAVTFDRTRLALSCSTCHLEVDRSQVNCMCFA